MALDPQKVIQIALSEVGYLEKKSNSQLDDKTANAGSKNYNKFAKLIDSIPGWYNGKKNGFAWCDVFVDSCFIRAFGAEIGRKAIYQPLKSLGAGCRYSRGYYKNHGALKTTPQPGDQIFFYPSIRIDQGSIAHTGLVYKTDSTYVYTVEGNASNRVRTKKYRLSDNKIAGYGRPNWSLSETSTSTTPAPSPAAEYPTLKQGASGSDVSSLQRLLNNKGAAPVLKVDGIFGPKTLAAVKAYQKKTGIPQNGIVSATMWAALKGTTVAA